MSEIKTNKVSPVGANGTVTLGDSGDTITIPAGATLTNSGTATGFGLFSAYAILREEQSSGTNGAAVAAVNTWQTQVINTEAADPSNIVTISSNQFTLGAGNYLISWTTVGNAAGSFWQSRLYDVTGSAVCTNGYGSTAEDATAQRSRHSIGNVRLTPSGTNVYRLECAGGNTSAAFWGVAGSRGTEVYREIIIYKES